MKDPGRINLDWALALLEGLAGAGLEQVVISPGSRSTPLVLAAILHPQLKHTVILDERCAAFTALGMARASGRPVALVATSGSAPGNWLPAVMEADESGVPLVLLSADRPWELQRCGANQTTDQLGLFGSHVRAFHQVSEAAEEEDQRRRLRALGRQLVLECRWPDPGPVHLNLPFREPLVPAGELPRPRAGEVRLHELPSLEPSKSLLERLREAFAAGPGLILCGESGATLESVPGLAEILGVPLLADPLSGLRFTGRECPNRVTAYPRFLASPEKVEELRPHWILQFGSLPLSAALRQALERWGVAHHWVVDPRGRRIDPLGLGVETLPVEVQALADELCRLQPNREEPRWLYRWRHAGEGLKELPPEGRLVRQVMEALPDGSLLFSGNSLAVRWLDAWSGQGARRIAIHGNRGLSGIDGNLSTFIGMVRLWKGRGRRLALLGDLTFQHDLGALANTAGLDAVVVVLQNGGGGIFDTLPQRHLPEFESCWRTPQAIDLAHLPGLFGVGFRRVEAVEELAPALEAAFDQGGFQVVEVLLPGKRV